MFDVKQFIEDRKGKSAAGVKELVETALRPHDLKLLMKYSRQLRARATA